jgi:hypothetical protein
MTSIINRLLSFSCFLRFVNVGKLTEIHPIHAAYPKVLSGKTRKNNKKAPPPTHMI